MSYSELAITYPSEYPRLLTYPSYDLINDPNRQQGTKDQLIRSKSDSTGQVRPLGEISKVTATLWEDEGTLCFQVAVKALLNVAGMTRGRRDAILKSEEIRHHVKIGPPHLKGIWIPFERALAFANKEKITESLYPLFVHNIGSFLYNPENASRKILEQTERPKQGVIFSPSNTVRHMRTELFLPTPEITPTHSEEIFEISDRQPEVTIRAEFSKNDNVGRPSDCLGYHTPTSLESIINFESRDWSSSTLFNESWEEMSKPTADHLKPTEEQSSAQEGFWGAASPCMESNPALCKDFPILGTFSSSDVKDQVAVSSSLQRADSPTTPSISETSSSTVLSSFFGHIHPEYSEDEEDSPLAFIRKTATILFQAYRKSVQVFRQCASNKTTSYDSGASNSHTPSKDEASQRSSTRKRKLGSDKDSEDGDRNSKKGKHRSKNPEEPPSDCNKPFACPFNKYDSHLFGPSSPEKSYSVCATSAFSNIAHLKQHLKRTHYLPDYFCFTCCEDFSSQSLLAEHQRGRRRCEPLDPPKFRERIGADLRISLNLDKKNATSTDQVKYWHEVYNTFFPGDSEETPVSPYYEGPIVELLHRFTRFTQLQMPRILATLLPRLESREISVNISQQTLQQEIHQEATRLFLEHISQIMMPQLGCRPIQRSLQTEDSALVDVNSSEYYPRTTLDARYQTVEGGFTRKPAPLNEPSMLVEYNSVPTPLDTGSRSPDLQAPTTQESGTADDKGNSTELNYIMSNHTEIICGSSLPAIDTSAQERSPTLSTSRDSPDTSGNRPLENSSALHCAYFADADGFEFSMSDADFELFMRSSENKLDWQKFLDVESTNYFDTPFVDGIS